MPRKSTGTVKWMRNKKTGKPQWHARWSRGDGTRTPYIGIDANIPETDREAALANARWDAGARLL